ncbi:MAG: HmuY family protein [Chitinophagaceae bacterium]|nr:HmuY family protein [Chitinophagaceae bacterium]
MKTKFILSTAVAAIMILSACKKEKTPLQQADPGAYKVEVSGKIVTVKNLPADTIVTVTAQGQPIGTGHYGFFSLETNQWIANSDSATAKWDLAFAGSTIRVNNATSGPGTGGAFVQVANFADVTSVSVDSTFRIDNHPVSYAIVKGSGKGWYNYDGVNVLLTPIAGRTLIVRTASGKYAKVEILNFYKGGVTLSTTASDADKTYLQRYYTFRYTFQSNGSKTF